MGGAAQRVLDREVAVPIQHRAALGEERRRPGSGGPHTGGEGQGLAGLQEHGAGRHRGNGYARAQRDATLCEHSLDEAHGGARSSLRDGFSALEQRGGALRAGLETEGQLNTRGASAHHEQRA
jgi:hypothetical protein